MTDPPDFNDRLTTYLAAAPICDVDPGAAHITLRARRRTKHRQIAGGALASVALLTSAGVVVNRLQTPGTVRTSAAKVKPAADDTTTTETTVAPQPASTVVFASAAGQQMAPGGIDLSSLKWPASNITWQRVDSSLSISNTSGFPGTGIHKDGDTFLAVSTEPASGKMLNPNEPNIPKTALYLSKDGVSWQQRSVPDLSLAGATMAEGSLYAVGTATATAQVAPNVDGNTVADLVVAVSKDGKTWKNQTLSFDVGSLANKGGQVAMGPVRIAHSGGTVLVHATVQVFLDPSKFLPKNVSYEQWGYEVRDGAIVVYGPPSAEAQSCRDQQSRMKDRGTFTPISPVPTAPTTTAVVDPIAESAPSTLPNGLSPACEAAMSAALPVAGTYKLADLGVDPAVADAIHNPVHLFASTGGGPFGPVPAPDGLSGQNNGNGFLAPVADGFLLGRTQYPTAAGGSQVATTTVTHSTDGKTWTNFGSFNGQTVSSGVTGGVFTVVVNDEKGTRLVRLKSDSSGFEDVSDSSSPTAAAIAMMGYQMSMGEAGYLAAFSIGSPFTAAVTVRHNGYSFLVTRDPNTGVQQLKVTEDATGAVVADGALIPDGQADSTMKLDKRIKWPIDGPVDITVVDDNGKTVVVINYGDLANQINQQQQAESVKSMRILDSPDGVSWSATSVSDLVDLSKVPVIAASNLIVDKDRYIVDLLVARTDGGPADTITFVGRRS